MTTPTNESNEAYERRMEISMKENEFFNCQIDEIVDDYMPKRERRLLSGVGRDRVAFKAAVGYIHKKNVANIDIDHVIALLDEIRVACDSPATENTIDYIERNARKAQAELVKNRIAPTPKKVLKRWVEIFQLESKHPERTFLSLGVIALAKENLDKMAGKTREEIPGSETFPDEWFTEAKG
jgi:hypothetical protein